MKANQKEVPIFFDVTGRRWRKLKIWVAVGLLALITSLSWASYRVVSTDELNTTVDMTTDAGKLANQISHTSAPVIGKGPLVRVVKVEGKVISSVFKGLEPRNLTKEEQAEVGSYQFAIERYGATASGRRLALTFDDGPDFVYTTQLLDVLSKESVPVTFFVVGNNIMQYPDLAKRMVREGHGIANHSFSHANLEVVPSLIAQQEVNITSRIMRSVTGYDSKFFRPPYIGDSDQSLRDSLHGIMQAQKLGYTIALYDYDTDDWKYATDASKISMPPFDGQDHVLLLHDGGGKRGATIEYVKALIKEAKRHNYTFARMDALYPKPTIYFERTKPSFEDRIAVIAIQAIYTWPLKITFALFTMTVIFVFIGLGVYVILASIQKRRTDDHTRLEKSDYRPAVAVIVPAYNEEKVLKSCIMALRKSQYQNLKIFIVDDGSTDKTWKIAQRLAAKYANVRALHQENAGKSAALNLAIKRTWSPVIIAIDADTVFKPDTISRLVRHFKDPYVGAVAGSVRVGNNSGLLARCQALEYSTSICLERTAQAYLNAIMVVPGACGAWRRKAIIDAGRYSSTTLAEDCDLTLGVHYAGYRVVQDNTAIATTEVPENIRSFARQRFRWAFGNVQVYWKYQNVLFSNKRGWLDSFVLPLAITSTAAPVLFLPLLGIISIENILHGQYFTLILFVGVSLAFQFIRAFIALRLGREKMSYLWVVPVARVIYGPLRVYLLYATILRAFQGTPVGWNKLARMGMSLPSSGGVKQQA